MTNLPHSELTHRRNVLFISLGGLGLYALTCAPGVLWQDSGMFQYRVRYGDVPGIQGLPLAHPLYILLARAFAYIPLGSFAYRVNLFSVVCAAVALGVAADLLWSLTRNRVAVACGALTLAVSHTFWMHAVIAEVYALYSLGLLVELWLIERFIARRSAYWLILALLVNGLNLSNHLLAILHWPMYAGLAIWAIRAGRLLPRSIPVLFVALLAGSSPYLWLIGSRLAAGQPFAEVMKEALVGPPQRAKLVLTHSFPFIKQVKNAFFYFTMNFPTPLALCAPIGAWAAWKQSTTQWFALVGGSLFVVGFAFAFRYLVPDQFVFYMPCYVLFAIFTGLGVAKLGRVTIWRPVVCVVLAALPAAVYEIAPGVLRSLNVAIGPSREITYRDRYAYFILPRKNGYTGAGRFAREALEAVMPDGLLYSDSTINNAVIYVRDVEGVGPGVTLAGAADIRPAEPTVQANADALEPFVRREAAFATTAAKEYLPKWFKERYEVEPHGLVHRIVEKDVAGP